MHSVLHAFYSQTAPATPPQSPIVQFLPFVLIAFVFYFVFFRPQQKQAKQHQAFLGALKRGDEVVTQGGIVGTVVLVEDRTATIDVGGGTTGLARSGGSLGGGQRLARSGRVSAGPASGRSNRPEPPLVPIMIMLTITTRPMATMPAATETKIRMILRLRASGLGAGSGRPFEITSTTGRADPAGPRPNPVTAPARYPPVPAPAP